MRRAKKRAHSPRTRMIAPPPHDQLSTTSLLRASTQSGSAEMTYWYDQLRVAYVNGATH